MYHLAESSWDAAEYEAIQRVIKSGRFTMGGEVRAYEQAFEQYFDSGYAVMTNSGSSANLLMIAGCRYSGWLPEGTVVAVPALAWSTTYAPLHQYGLRIMLVDIDPRTLTIDPNSLAEALDGTPKPSAVLAVNILGNACDYSSLRALCSRSGALLLEDNCESMGAVYDDQYTGTFGTAGTFSTFFAHHICTMEGGVAVTKDQDLYEIMLALRAHGWTRDIPNRNNGSFEFVVPGYNLRPLEMSGAIGREQLKKLPAIVEQRRRNAALFRKVINDFPWITTQEETGQSSWMAFTMVTETKEQKHRLVESLNRRKVEHRTVLAGNFLRSRMSDWMDVRTGTSNLDAADHVHDCGLFVGNHPNSMDEEMDTLRSALKEAL